MQLFVGDKTCEKLARSDRSAVNSWSCLDFREAIPPAIGALNAWQ